MNGGLGDLGGCRFPILEYLKAMNDEQEKRRQREIAATPRGDDPLIDWDLTVNDKRFLRGIKIDPYPRVPTPEPEE